MLEGHRITFGGPHPIKSENMLLGRRFSFRGPRVADPWYIIALNKSNEQLNNLTAVWPSHNYNNT